MEQNLSQYKIFYEVAKAGNISKAAKELYISQPAISKAISKLEDSLGLSLFTRSSRGVQLTSEGEILFEHTREAFDALDRGEQELKRIQEFDIGHLRIGVSNTLCKYILLPYLKTFIDQYPHMKVTIESQATAQTLARLEQQKIDLGLVAEPSVRRDLAFIPVMDIQDTFVTTPNYLENLYLIFRTYIFPYVSCPLFCIYKTGGFPGFFRGHPPVLYSYLYPPRSADTVYVALVID